MASKEEIELVKAAWALSKSNVEQWERYMTALDNYTRLWSEKAVCAPSAELVIAVGMARQAVQFNKEMQLLDETNEKIKKLEERQR